MGLNETELNQLSDADLRRAFAPVRDAANKRIRRLEQASSVYSPALSGITKSGGLLYNQDKDRVAQIEELKRGMSFLSYQTSTVKGAREWTKKMEGRKLPISSVGFADMTAEQMGQYWKIMHKMEELGIKLDSENYDIVKAVLRNSVASNNPTQEFLNSIAGESHQYILDHMSESSDPVDRILSMISSYVDWKANYGESILQEIYEEDEEDFWSTI